MSATGPLAGLKVIELAHIMAGPVCGQLLADMGADVIKVEKVPGGDDTRRMVPPQIDGESAAFNAFLRDLFERYRDRSPAFLSQVETDGNLGVITAEEDPDGGLTKEQAETWLRPAAGTGVSMVEIPVDDDDGLDDLA